MYRPAVLIYSKGVKVEVGQSQAPGARDTDARDVCALSSAGRSSASLAKWPWCLPSCAAGYGIH